MRKHFLILMLLALLPLSGWADVVPTEYDGGYPVDLSDGWAIELVPPTATYTGEVQTPTVRLRKGDVYIPSTKFTVTWGEGNRKDVSNVGYTVTVTNDMTNTIKTLETPTAEFWILKANNAVSTLPTMASPASVSYSGSEFTFVATKGAANFGEVEFIVSADAPAANAAGWSTDSPKATNPGTYKVWYRAPGTSNYNASNPVALGTFVIDGLDPVVTTAPQAIASLTYNGTAKNLITAGVVSTTPTLNGTLWYRYKLHTASDWEDWDMSVPQATNGGDYDVQWKLVGATGYDNIDAQNVVGVSIAPATVTISTEPTKATELTYNGASRALITSEGVAGLNAPVTYTVTYKAPNAADFSPFLPAGTAYADVKATNAGTYRVVAGVAASANFNAVSGNNNDVVIAQAKAFETAPSAKDLRYTGQDQVLIQEAEGTAPGVIEYKLGTDDYTTAIASIKASAVASYTVKYKVTNTNYQPVAETTIENVKIKGALLTVKINDITKVYDGTTTLNAVNVNYTEAECNAANAGITGFAGAGATVGVEATMTTANGYSKNYHDGEALEDDVFDIYLYNTNIGPARVDANYVTTAMVKTPANYTVDGDKARVEFISTLAGYTTTGDELNYAAVTQKNYKEGGYPGVLTINEAAYKTANPNFDINFIKGKLTIAQKELYVTAKDQAALTTKVGAAYTLGNKYDVTGIVNTENPWATDKAPVLTSNAPNPLVAGEYTLSFTPGTLNTTDGKNYKMRSENPYVIPAGLKFKVNPADGSKVVITILPHDKYYGDADPNFTEWENGTDYYISGLITGDEVQNLTFSRSAGETVADGPYALTATATLKNPTWYDESLAIVPSTFTIKKAPVKVSIATQTVKKGDVSAFDNTKWEVVSGLKGDDATIGKSVLEGTLTNEQGVASSGTFANGLKLVIVNPNYTLVNANEEPVAYVTGTLRVLENDQIILGTDMPDLATQLATLNNTEHIGVNFDAMPMAANEWRAMVLPFEVTTVELVQKLGVYVVVNKFKGASYDKNKPTKVNVNFGIEMNKIEAGVPFLIKPAEDITWNETAAHVAITFENKTIVGAPIAQGQGAATPTEDKATFTGTYNKGEILWWGHGLDGTTTNPLKSKWLCYDGATRYATGDPTTTDGTYQTTSTKSENTWKEPEGRPHLLSPMEAYVILDADATESRIFVEDFENGTTVIKELGVNGTSKAYSVDGWYTLNGIKLQGVPTEKGIYINNGKKVVIK